MFDPNTYDITAILDFDFAHIGSPLSEYLLADFSFNYIFPGAAEEDADMVKLRDQLLNGFPPPQAETEDLSLSKIFDDALIKVGAQRPATIREAALISDIWWCSQDVCQPFWFMPHLSMHMNAERIEQMRSGCEKDVTTYMNNWGY